MGWGRELKLRLTEKLAAWPSFTLSWFHWQRTPLIVLLVLVFYYGAGAMLMHKINDAEAFAPPHTPSASAAVEMTAALIEREVITGHWVANDPFFIPSAVLDNMPNYQQGIVYALSRFAVQLTDQLGRARGSSQVDVDLDRAAGLLKYPGTVWIYDSSISLLPTASSESQYRAAREALLRYNQRVASGQAIYERRADNLINVLDAIAADLGSRSALSDSEIGAGFFDFTADDVFYGTKGRLYAYAKIIEALGVDFADLINQRELTTIWQQLQNSLNEAARLQPLIVINGAADSNFLPSHLATQGFYVLRARVQLRELTNTLSK